MTGFQIKKVREHYDLYLDGEFIGSADNYGEIDELRQELEPVNTVDYVAF